MGLPVFFLDDDPRLIDQCWSVAWSRPAGFMSSKGLGQYGHLPLELGNQCTQRHSPRPRPMPAGRMHARTDPGAVDSSDLGVVSRPSPPRRAKRPSRRVWRKRSPSREDVCCGGCAAAAYVDVAEVLAQDVYPVYLCTIPFLVSIIYAIRCIGKKKNTVA